MALTASRAERRAEFLAVRPVLYRVAPHQDRGRGLSEQLFRSHHGKSYRFVNRLGADGGFGSVILVEDDDDGGRFALKTLHFGVAPEVLAVEAENLSRVSHENVVRYVDFGSDPEVFLVMELAAGGTLKDYLAEARERGEHFPLDTLIEWSRGLLQGLGAIHGVLLHRDLKPGNIMLSADTLKIGDFGIARLVEASTREETFKGGGTAAYMPPEGWAGIGGPSPTVAYDLYSLGVVLFELATLQLPFSGDRDQLRSAHLYSEPPAPTTLRPDLPLPLERLILQLLRKTPSQRGESAEAALEVLATMSANASETTEETSALLARLQEGASALMREAAEREAEMARTHQAKREMRERSEAATHRLDEMLAEALALVEKNVAPLVVSAASRRGIWQFELEQSPRRIRVEIAPPSSPELLNSAENAPGEIVLFGHVEVSEEGRTLGGANLVGYTHADAPWVIQFQSIQLKNQALMSHYMREYEPFFLTTNEIPEHGRWLWGGAMHVFNAEHAELTRDVLMEWLALLLPGSR